MQKIDRSIWIMIAGLLLGAALAATQWIKPRQASFAIQSQSTEVKENSVGSIAGDFSLQALTGETIRMQDLLGKPVVLNFWATWCAPCELEMPLFQEFYAKHAPELEILAINYQEPVEDIQAFADRLKLRFPVLLDPDGEASDLYRVRALPVTYFIDREGIVQDMYLGTLSRTKFEALLAKIGVSE